MLQGAHGGEGHGARAKTTASLSVLLRQGWGLRNTEARSSAVLKATPSAVMKTARGPLCATALDTHSTQELSLAPEDP